MEKSEREIKEEMLELNEQFSEFLHTKGIAAKFKLAFKNMGESAHKQHERDVAAFEEVKANSAEEEKSEITVEGLAEEFNEFLKSKGLDTQYTVVVTEAKQD